MEGQEQLELLCEGIMHTLPADGSFIGNNTLKKYLATSMRISDELYKSAVHKLGYEGLIRTGGGRGGSVALITASPQHQVSVHPLQGAESTTFQSLCLYAEGTQGKKGGSWDTKPRQVSLFDEEAIPRFGEVNAPFLTDQIITYIGNKRSLLPFIGNGLNKIKNKLNKHRITSFDVFSGSGIVARYMKDFSDSISTCDLELYSAIINSCYLSNVSSLDINLIKKWIDQANDEGINNPIEGIITKFYAPEDDANIKIGERVFYTKRNAMFIDTARMVIENAPSDIKNHLLAPLLYVASVHANTSGVFKGFYKNSKTGIGQFGGNGKNALVRICKPFNIPYPIFSETETNFRVYQGDSNQLAKEHSHVDVAYIDPPYNQHPYGSNYFMLNVIANNEMPPVISEISGIPENWNRSDYNIKAKTKAALFDLASNIDAKYLLISFNSEGYITKDEMLDMLALVGKTEVLETTYNTFRGSRNLENRDIYVTEYLFLVEK